MFFEIERRIFFEICSRSILLPEGKSREIGPYSILGILSRLLQADFLVFPSHIMVEFLKNKNKSI